MYAFDGYMGEQRPADDATAAEAADATVRKDGRCVVPSKGHHTFSSPNISTMIDM